MYTINRLIKRGRTKKHSKKNNKIMIGKPQRKAIVTQIRIEKPRKPNSASRKVASIRFSNKQSTTVYIPGEGHNLQEHSIVIVRGARINDLTGIHCKAIRGVEGLDAVNNRKQGRSRYGTSKNK
jgi:small subunit ribosomal protein S12